MPYKDPDKNKIYQRLWQRKKATSGFDIKICRKCKTTENLTFGEEVLCRSCLRKQNQAHKKLPDVIKRINISKKKAKLTLRRKAGVKYHGISDDVAYLWVLVSRGRLYLKAPSEEVLMDIELVKKDIANPAHRELAGAILETIEEIKSGKKGYNQGMTELAGYKQIIQLMALEVMRTKVRTDMIGR